MEPIDHEALARSALEAYALAEAGLHLIGADWNHTFRIDAAEETFALRLYRADGRSDAEIRTELAWLEALARSGDVRVARPIPTRGGELVARVDHGGRERRAALFDWVAGAMLGDDPTPSQVARFGEGIARLHAHGRTFGVTAGLRTWDSPFPQGGGASPFAEASDGLLPAHARALRDRVALAAREAIAGLEASGEPARLVHGDLHQENVVVDDRGELWFLDFDDCLLAWPVQDLGVTMWEVAEDEATWPYRDALREGYERIARWPERAPGEIDVFAADRGLIKLDDVVQDGSGRDPDGLRASVLEHASAIAWFLDRAKA